MLGRGEGLPLFTNLFVDLHEVELRCIVASFTWGCTLDS